ASLPATAPIAPRLVAPGTRPPGTADEPPRRSVLSGLLLWLVIVGAVFGGGGFYAYKKGLIFAKTPGGAGGDSTVARGTSGRDTTRLAAADSSRDSAQVRTTPPAPPAMGTPGHLVLQNVPAGARISIEGQPVRGNQVDLPPGVHRLKIGRACVGKECRARWSAGD